MSGALVPALLSSDVDPSCCSSVTVVPAGNVFAATVMSKVSVPLPRFHTSSVNVKVEPAGAEATVTGSPVPLVETVAEPFATTAAVCSTW